MSEKDDNTIDNIDNNKEEIPQVEAPIKSKKCPDAQIFSLSWVSFGLEPATDGSGRRTHPLRRVGSRTTTTPSTVTSSTVAGRTRGRPGAAWSAPLRPVGTGRAQPSASALA